MRFNFEKMFNIFFIKIITPGKSMSENSFSAPPCENIRKSYLVLLRFLFLVLPSFFLLSSIIIAFQLRKNV